MCANLYWLEEFRKLLFEIRKVCAHANYARSALQRVVRKRSRCSIRINRPRRKDSVY